MINTDVQDAAIIRYAGTLDGSIEGIHDTGGMDAFRKGGVVNDECSEKERQQDRLWIEVKTDDLKKLLQDIRSVLVEIDSLLGENELLTAYILSNLNVAKGKICELKVKSNATVKTKEIF